MPTSTLPFEVSLEFVNDTAGPVILQLSRGDDELSGNSTILHPQETISLILNAGSTYHYILTQHILRMKISVRIWKDMHISATDVLVNKGVFHDNQSAESQGITIICPDKEAIEPMPLETLRW
ncbi:hypothetical protein BYT27DRAFT_7256078 [Phlegmacium glaucopus]|nr:hypothetical protein BYT27DRAFT_7256078 [Phlegmacium glaucopus]